MSEKFAFYFLTHKYRLISKKGEGTFSEVIKAQSLKTSSYVAIKCMKNVFENVDGVNSLREIQALKRLSPHPHVIRLLEVLYDKPSGRLALVFELCDLNLYEMIRPRRPFEESRVRKIVYQIIKAVEHMHSHGIFHRDIKPENILLMQDVVKLADYGSCRGITSKPPFTDYISTRWYRAPECLLTNGHYESKMDIWGIGCVFFEIMALHPLFPGANEVDQMSKIHAVFAPDARTMQKFKAYTTRVKYSFNNLKPSGIRRMLPHMSELGLDLLEQLLKYDPEQRISAKNALQHAYFADIHSQPLTTTQIQSNSNAPAAIPQQTPVRVTQKVNEPLISNSSTLVLPQVVALHSKLEEKKKTIVPTTNNISLVLEPKKSELPSIKPKKYDQPYPSVYHSFHQSNHMNSQTNLNNNNSHLPSIKNYNPFAPSQIQTTVKGVSLPMKYPIYNSSNLSMYTNNSASLNPYSKQSQLSTKSFAPSAYQNGFTNSIKHKPSVKPYGPCFYEFFYLRNHHLVALGSSVR